VQQDVPLDIVAGIPEPVHRPGENMCFVVELESAPDDAVDTRLRRRLGVYDRKITTLPVCPEVPGKFGRVHMPEFRRQYRAGANETVGACVHAACPLCMC
jgi:hypothetical protein